MQFVLPERKFEPQEGAGNAAFWAKKLPRTTARQIEKRRNSEPFVRRYRKADKWGDFEKVRFLRVKAKRIQTLVAGTEPKRVFVNHIIQAVLEVSEGITRDDMISHRRQWHLARARQVVMYVASQLTTLSVPAIGAQLGGRDHSTILHGKRKIACQIKAGNEETVQLVEEVTRRAKHIAIVSWRKGGIQ